MLWSLTNHLLPRPKKTAPRNMAAQRLVRLKNLSEELLHTLLRFAKSRAPCGGCAVLTANPAACAGLLRTQEASFFQTVEERIEGAGTDPVAVPFQLFYHFESPNGALTGMKEDVDANQAGVQILMVAARSAFTFSHALEDTRPGTIVNALEELTGF